MSKKHALTKRERRALERRTIERPIAADIPTPPGTPPPMWPFRQYCDVYLQGEVTAILTDIAITVWRLGSPRQTSKGEEYSWQAIASNDLADSVVGLPNRVLDVSGIRLRVMDARVHTLVPHVELALNEMRPGG